jgi:hypothetical protein
MDGLSLSATSASERCGAPLFLGRCAAGLSRSSFSFSDRHKWASHSPPTILSVKDYPGVEGTYNFDQNGDGLRCYNVVKNDNGKIVFIKHIDLND